VWRLGPDVLGCWVGAFDAVRLRNGGSIVAACDDVAMPMSLILICVSEIFAST
jgi:hypothetical protein